MEDYKITKNTVSLIKYHFVFCPRYKRKIFKIQDVEERFKEIVQIESNKIGIEIIQIESGENYVHLFLNSLPNLSPADIMNKLKGVSSKILREEFIELSKMPSLWTRNYLVSTEESIRVDLIEEYVKKQKARY